jgi:Cu+-exporting ATPase
MDQTLPARRIELTIGGLNCASCVSRVEKVLKHVPGVQDVSVNLMTGMAHVQGSVSVSALIEAVSRAGYTATQPEVVKPDTGRRELVELIAAFILSAPVVLGMVLRVPDALQLVLASIVQFWLGARFYRAGFAALRAGSGNMDLLVALGTSAAYGLSVWDFFSGGPLYFESAVAIITLVRLGKYLEGRAKRDAANSIAALQMLRPEVAHVPGGGDVPVSALVPGDEIELRPGERVPADGVIVDGAGSLDESPVTGEALPMTRAAGDKLLAGTLNLNAVLRLRVTALAGESFLDRMARLIEEAQGSKPRVQKLADRVASVFVPVVVVLALCTFGGWLAHGAAYPRAIINAVSVLVIACPCAMGLATPAAILAGTGAAAKRGILFRNADALQAAAHVDTLVFDKTGTLTTGQPHLMQVLTFGDMPEAQAREIAAALAAGDTHPLSAALCLSGIAPARDVTVLPGKGVTGEVDGIRYMLGSAALVPGAPPALGHASWSYLGKAEGTALAGFAFTDTIRPDAHHAVEGLRTMGLRTVLLTGDRKAAGEALVRELGIENLVTEADPAGKLAKIRELRAAGRRVAMLGDGINDAAALVAADVGMAMGNGADVAIEAADISLLQPEPLLAVAALRWARKTWAVLVQGLFWAMIYNVIGIPAAAFGLLSPALAGGAMAASSLCVLGNALRLRHWRLQ